MNEELSFRLFVLGFLMMLLGNVLYAFFRLWKEQRSADKERSTQPRKVLLEIEILSAPARPPPLL